MIVSKWNFSKKEYQEYELPEGSSLYENDMNNKVRCAECGEELAYGSCYTSRTIHNHMGLGYGVCILCYKNELDMEVGALK